MQVTRRAALIVLIFSLAACSPSRQPCKPTTEAQQPPSRPGLMATTAPSAAPSSAGSPRARTTTTTTTRAAAPRPHNAARWEKEVAAMEAADKLNPPPKGGVLFIGSSTIRGWRTLREDFPGHAVVNRGFGGSQIVDSTHYVDRLIVPHAPRMVLIRAGGNDIHAGKSAEQVFREFQEFVAAVHAKLPRTEVVFIGLAPAPVRWDERDANKKLNELVEAWSRTTPRVRYVETYDTTVNADGSPREELFVKDRLHFNAEGYKLLADRVRPALPK